VGRLSGDDLGFIVRSRHALRQSRNKHMSISAIKQCIRDLHAAKEDLAAVVAETFPIGADISWDKSGHRQHGKVIFHGNTGSVRVENERTGKQYWIGMYDVVGYVK
jgi:hypothetical protein